MNASAIIKRVDRTGLPVLFYIAIAVRAVLAVCDWFSQDSAASTTGYPVAVSLVAFIAGIFKVASRHPRLNTRYGAWLLNSPWRWPQRLPLGNVTLDWTDATAIILLAVFSPSPFLIATITFTLAYAAGYVGTATYVALATGESLLPTSLVVLFGLAIAGFCVPDGPSLVSTVVAVALALAVSQKSLWNTLASLQISDAFLEARTVSSAKANKAPPGPRFGSPYTELLSTDRPDSIRAKRLIIKSVAAMIWLAACVDFTVLRLHHWSSKLASGLDGEPLSRVESFWHVGTGELFENYPRYGAEMYGYAFLAALVGSLAVLAAWTKDCASPRSLWGRLASGKLIIPQHDKIYLVPLLAFSAYVILAVAGVLVRCPTILSVVTALSATALISAYAIPWLDDWCYTGHHRIALRRRR